MSNAEFQSGRRLWRTLMFQQAFLAETLAFVPTSWTEDIRTLDVVYEAEDASLKDLVHGQMAKLAILKACIVTETSQARGVSLEGIETIMESLRSFYKQLPRQMELRHAYELSTENRRSVYYCHIFYLGGIILVYRIIADHIARAAHHSPTSSHHAHSVTAAMSPYLEEGLFATRMSCRVLKLLWSEAGLYRRCWLTVFTAYVSCVVLMNAIARVQVEEGQQQATNQDDLDNAAVCLSILEWSAEFDDVAARFYNTLKPMHRALSDFSAGNGSRNEAARNVLKETAQLLSHPMDETLNVRQRTAGSDFTNDTSSSPPQHAYAYANSYPGSYDSLSNLSSPNSISSSNFNISSHNHIHANSNPNSNAPTYTANDLSQSLQQLDLAYENDNTPEHERAKLPYHWGTARDLPAKITDRFGVKPIMHVPPQAYYQGADGEVWLGGIDGTGSKEQGGGGEGKRAKRARFAA